MNNTSGIFLFPLPFFELRTKSVENKKENKKLHQGQGCREGLQLPEYSSRKHHYSISVAYPLCPVRITRVFRVNEILKPPKWQILSPSYPTLKAGPLNSIPSLSGKNQRIKLQFYIDYSIAEFPCSKYRIDPALQCKSIMCICFYLCYTQVP